MHKHSCLCAAMLRHIHLPFLVADCLLHGLCGCCRLISKFAGSDDFVYLRRAPAIEYNPYLLEARDCFDQLCLVHICSYTLSAVFWNDIQDLWVRGKTSLACRHTSCISCWPNLQRLLHHHNVSPLNRPCGAATDIYPYKLSMCF